MFVFYLGLNLKTKKALLKVEFVGGREVGG